MISGNIKAVIPLFREKLGCEDLPEQYITQFKFKRGKLEPLYEKRIFGILTAHQVGYVPNVKVNFTENEETFCQDTYVFKSLIPFKKKAYTDIDLNDEMYKEQVINEYDRTEIDEVD